MSTAKAIGNSTLQLPDAAENYSLPTLVADLTAIANEVNAEIAARVMIKHAEYVSTILTGAGAQWDIGPLALTGVSANIVNNTFSVANAASGKLNFTEPGVYEVSVVAVPTAAPGGNYIAIRDGADTFMYNLRESTGAIKWEMSCSAHIFVPVASVASPKTIFFRCQTANAVTVNSTVRVNKMEGP